MSDEALPGGRSVPELQRIARYVVGVHRGLIHDREEAQDVAMTALVERVYAPGPAPTGRDLIRTARDAVCEETRREASYCGLDTNARKTGREGTALRWAAYWHGDSALASPFEDALIERVAVRQLTSALSPRSREVLDALAEYGTYKGARGSIGVDAKTWCKRIHAARAEARDLWYWPESAAPQWGEDNPSGRPDPQGRNRGLRHVRRLKELRAAAKKEVAA